MNEIIKEMISEANQALENAYAPYSNFSVSCCLLTENNQLFTGVNVENSSYPLSLCAEACAVSHMILSGQRRIKDIVLLCKEGSLCPPCGACRQILYEFSTPNTQIHLCAKNTVMQTLTINQLLPHAFCLKTHCG